MYKVKVLDKKALPGFALVEYIEFETLAEAEAYAKPYWNDPVDFMAILEDTSVLYK